MNLKNRVRSNEPLKGKTTFKIGGGAKFFAEPKDAADLKLLLISAKRYKIPVLVMGAGSNILVKDEGVAALVVRLSSPYFKKASFSGNKLTVGSGVMLGDLIRRCAKRDLSGLEFMSGIPGTLGGALAMNAGAWGRSIADSVEKIKVMDHGGKLLNIKAGAAKFGYRRSGLAKYIILEAVFKLRKSSRKTIEAAADGYLKSRRMSQDSSSPNAGCIFKNPKDQSAGKLIDLCGLKGRGVGGARVSMRHANFILNYKSAKAQDVLKLMDLIQKKVKARFRITLTPEIKIWQ